MLSTEIGWRIRMDGGFAIARSTPLRQLCCFLPKVAMGVVVLGASCDGPIGCRVAITMMNHGITW